MKKKKKPQQQQQQQQKQTNEEQQLKTGLTYLPTNVHLREQNS